MFRKIEIEKIVAQIDHRKKLYESSSLQNDILQIRYSIILQNDIL